MDMTETGKKHFLDKLQQKETNRIHIGLYSISFPWQSPATAIKKKKITEKNSPEGDVIMKSGLLFRSTGHDSSVDSASGSGEVGLRSVLGRVKPKNLTRKSNFSRFGFQQGWWSATTAWPIPVGRFSQVALNKRAVDRKKYSHITKCTLEEFLGCRMYTEPLITTK